MIVPVGTVPCFRELQSPVGRPSLCELSPQRVGLDEVRERALAVDLDDGQPLAVARLQLGVSADVDLLELEAELLSCRLDDAPRGRAEVAPRSRKQDYAGRLRPGSSGSRRARRNTS
jgi:hypothetical protein